MRQVDIAEVQRVLEIHQVDGWLLFDFQKRNALAIEFLQIPHKAHLTRRLYYWIPQKGSPVKIVHAIEPFFLDAWPGQKHIYSTWQQLEGHLCQILKGKKKVAMEFSEHCHIPYVSVVDAGSVDFVRSQGCQVVSSASFLQAFTCLLNQSQKNSHFAAAKVLEEAVDSAWSFIARQLKNEMIITEYDVQQHVKEYYTSKGYVSEGDPICAVNEHSSDPHYCPTKEHSYQIKKDDFILIDLWCKRNDPDAIYADICRVGVAARCPTDKQQHIFSIVRSAQRQTAEFIKEALLQGRSVTGAEADLVARSVIRKAGYAEFFIHRTGHNIFTKDHGPGTHLDSYETEDDRILLPGTCFSIEPGIYLPQEFGVRLEYDVYISPKNTMVISGGEQDEIICLM